MPTYPERLAALQPFWGAWYLDAPIGEGSYGKVFRVVKTDTFGQKHYAALKWLWIPHSPGDIQDKRNSGYTDQQIARDYMDMAQSFHKEIMVMKRLSGDLFGLTACLWTVGRNRRTRRKPTQTRGEHADATQK